MQLVREFREFAMRGNVIDLAVGVIIGAAFGKIVSSLVDNIMTPILGLVIGGVSFKDLSVTLADRGVDAKPVVLQYGVFLQNVFDFLIVAVAIFAFVKALNSLRRKEEAAPPTAPSREQELLTEIRDLLAAKR